MSSISKLWRKLETKEYRDGYTQAQLSIEVPFQIRALRKARGWTQAQLAERCGIPQARISHIEQPGRDPLSLRTLYRLSAAFDVGLLVEFVPFSELIRREAAFDPKTFSVPSFKDDRMQTVFSIASTSAKLSSFRSASTPGRIQHQRQVAERWIQAWRPRTDRTVWIQHQPQAQDEARPMSLKTDQLPGKAPLWPPSLPVNPISSIPGDYRYYSGRMSHAYETQVTG